jgi:hypothetical protein
VTWFELLGFVRIEQLALHFQAFRFRDGRGDTEGVFCR